MTMSEKKKLTYNQRVAVSMLMIAGYTIVLVGILAGYVFLVALFPVAVLSVTLGAFALWVLFRLAQIHVNERWSDDL